MAVATALTLGALPARAEAGAAKVALPQPLPPADVARYGEIFALQEKGRWRAADRRIKRLGDPLLMGHLLAQRYLHPTHYRSRFRELRSWMAKYAGLPDARRIYRLAVKRRPKKARWPRRPKATGFPWWSAVVTGAAPYRSRKRLTRAQRRRRAVIKRQISRHLRRGHIKRVEHILTHQEFQQLFDRVEIDRAKADIAAAHFYRGDNRKALKLAELTLRGKHPHLVLAHWTAGLASWRLGRLERAARHFEAVAQAKTLSPWNQASGAFWAARAHLVGRHPQHVNHWLRQAAAHPRTFYGLVAHHTLGRKTPFNWGNPALDPSGLQALDRMAAGRRAFALLQLGETRRAERELGNAAAWATPELRHTILAVASRADMARLAFGIGERLTDAEGRQYLSAAFPAPPWRPKGGFKVDRALIYALMRQESGFNSRAKSRSGARGLMQLMPATARFISGNRRYRGRGRNRLYDPELNLSLAQKYLQHLLSHKAISGDVILVTAAYNGGPGNLMKWQRRLGRGNDPLMFIESIPSRETRIFIERVLANFWIYRNRLGQPAPSLDAVASGDWPTYVKLDGLSVVEHAGR
ncbi:MAG: lytic transglycosylase domain-containing protein [Alphaproteobacteria bacterium]